MEVNNIYLPNLAFVPLNCNWLIAHHRLYDLDPYSSRLHEAKVPVGFSVWDAYFHQDLLLIENSQRMRLIDTGWYPDSDSNGEFLVRLIQGTLSDDMVVYYDWEHPLHEFRSRSVKSVIDQITFLIGGE